MCCRAPPRGGGACPRSTRRGRSGRRGPRFVPRGQDVLLGAAAGRRRVPPQRQEGPERAEGASFRVCGGARSRPGGSTGSVLRRRGGLRALGCGDVAGLHQHEAVRVPGRGAVGRRLRPESPPEARVSMGLVRALALHRLAKPTGRHGLVQHCSMERADAPVQLAGSRAVPGGK